VAARRREIGVRQVGVAAVGYGVAMAAMALAPNVAVALVLGVVLGLASISFIVSSTAIVQLRSAPEMRGRVLAIQAMLFLGSTPVGGPIVGWVAEEFGARYSVALGAAAALLAGVWGLAAARRNATLGVEGQEVVAADADPEAMVA
jgi:MFS family permease